MCGISGIYEFSGGTVNDTVLTAMRDTLIHRGPDSGENYISPSGVAGISQRRLAIIDLSPEANCPMPNADRTLWITFNGEIYNFKPLREELQRKGYTFRTQGDTEVILYGYQEYGADFVRRLNGMFAFAIWDEKRQELFAARDHVGVKPFYYALQNGAFYFGSEIKAILAHPRFKKELDEPMLGHYLAFSAMPAPYTLFRDVQKLPAAHSLLIGADGVVRTQEYWNPLKPEVRDADAEIPAAGNDDEAQWTEKIRTLLGDSINMQMIADVPFGCFLSGGIDSSLNAAMMSAALGTPVETFSIGTDAGKDGDAKKYNEFEYSRLMAERLHAKRHEKLVSYEDFLNFLPQYGTCADDPNGDQTCFLVYYLSQLVQDNGVVVVQTGEGGDELFGGYETYLKAARLHGSWKKLARLPKFLRGLPHGVASLFGASDFTREYLRRLAEDQEPFWGHAIAFTPLQKKRLLSAAYRDRPDFYGEYAVIEKYYREADKYAPHADILNRIGYLELKMRLADFLLMRVDKMAMSHSIEARVPFLDPRIVETALAIPQAIKIKNGDLKHILKKVAAEFLPAEIIDRKKQGFGAPLEEWFRDPETAQPLLAKIYNSALAARGIFNYEEVRALAARHAKGENHTFRLMNLLTLSLWYDRWFAEK